MTRAQLGRLTLGATRRLLTRVRGVLDGCSVARIRNAGLVLTGGASELLGLEAFAAAEFGRTVRVSAPPRLEGAVGRMSAGGSSPAFACVVGLAMAAAAPADWIAVRETAILPRGGYLGRVEQWLRESF